MKQSEVLYPRDIRTGMEAMAYTFYRDCPIETIFILFGVGANGKSVFTSLLTALIGPDNTSNLPLSDMSRDLFALSDLQNKDLNIDNELAGKTITDTSILKKLTGGSRQKIRVQKKYVKAYDIQSHAKLFFNANEMPFSQDKTDAYNRRLTIISFPIQFEGKRADKDLINKLTTPEELSGIFNILMHCLRTILKTNEIYASVKTIEEKRLKYERTLNPVKSFLEEAILEESTTEDYIPKTDCHNAYMEYCNEYTLPIQGYNNFCKILKNDFSIAETRKTLDKNKDERVMCWSGLRLVPKYAPKTAQTTLI